MRRTLNTAIFGALPTFFAWDKLQEHRSYHKAKLFANELETTLPSKMLARVMRDHGYNPRQQAAIMAILDANDVKFPTTTPDLATANKIFKDTTQQLLRKGERWSTMNQTIEQTLQTHKQKLLLASRELNMISASKPDPSKVNGFTAIIPGATEAGIKGRFQTLLAAIKFESYKFDRVIAATGYRKLLSEECQGVDLPERTEAAMIQYCWNELVKEHPSLATLPFKISTAPIKEKQKRSTTVDTAEALEKNLEKDCKGLVIFIAKPYSERFFPIFNRYLASTGLPIAVYAKGLNPETTNLFLFQDELARKIYFQFEPLAQFYIDQHKEAEKLAINFNV